MTDITMNETNDVFVSLTVYIPRFNDAVANLIRSLRSHEIKKLAIFKDLCEGLLYIHEASSLLELGFTKKENFYSLIELVISTYELSDYVLLADYLEYELFPIVCGIEDFCNKFVNQVL